MDRRKTTHSRSWQVLLARFLLTCTLAACASAPNAPPSKTRLELSRIIVIERLVSLGFERAQATRAVAALSSEQLATLAASLGTPFAPSWILEPTCVFLLLLVLVTLALAWV